MHMCMQQYGVLSMAQDVSWRLMMEDGELVKPAHMRVLDQTSKRSGK
jgi:hypothetical protein